MGIVEFKELLNTDSGLARYRRESAGEFSGMQYVKIDMYPANFNSSEYSELILKLKEACKENELKVFGVTKEYIVSDYDYRTYYSFYVVEVPENPNPIALEGFGKEINFDVTYRCLNCDTEGLNAFANMICPNCETINCCESCGNNFHEHIKNNTAQTQESWELFLVDDTISCTNCLNECTSCGERWRNRNNYSGSTLCQDCDPRFYCTNCNAEEYGEASDNGLCAYCNGIHCDLCENFVDEEYGTFVIDEDNGERMCSRCFNGLEKNIEVFDNDSEMTSTKLALPTIEGRERIRFCGLEIEGVNVVNNAHNILAADFYDMELSTSNVRRGYHDRSEGGFVHVERDSSCDWEVVVGPINMATNADVRNLNRVIR